MVSGVERAMNAVTGALFMAVGARLASEQQEAAERYRS
jgi:hypothetical protein